MLPSALSGERSTIYCHLSVLLPGRSYSRKIRWILSYQTPLRTILWKKKGRHDRNRKSFIWGRLAYLCYDSCSFNIYIYPFLTKLGTSMEAIFHLNMTVCRHDYEFWFLFIKLHFMFLFSLNNAKREKRLRRCIKARVNNNVQNQQSSQQSTNKAPKLKPEYWTIPLTTWTYTANRFK